MTAITYPLILVTGPVDVPEIILNGEHPADEFDEDILASPAARLWDAMGLPLSIPRTRLEQPAIIGNASDNSIRESLLNIARRTEVLSDVETLFENGISLPIIARYVKWAMLDRR